MVPGNRRLQNLQVEVGNRKYRGVRGQKPPRDHPSKFNYLALPAVTRQFGPSRTDAQDWEPV